MPAASPLLLVRTARPDDVDGLYRLALGAGAGLTNLPADRDALAERLDASMRELAAPAGQGAGRPMMLVLEADGEVSGTAMVVSHVGAEWPFYSYKMSRISSTSRDLGRTVSTFVLNLVNDFEGHAEVGGLYLDPRLRGTAAGRMIARSRYLFIAEHRDWFGDYVVAELRGVQDATGKSPFWEAVGRQFYQMEFEEADGLNSRLGNQFIADLGPRYPIYVNLLPEAARNVLGQPHMDGRRAYELLLQEGFRDDDYLDIFDAGPTIEARIDELVAVRDSRTVPLVRVDGAVDADGLECLVSAGRGADFRATRGRVSAAGEAARIGSALAHCLRVQPGDVIRHVAF
jgi:arginine N-succinyltransferase